ncbi:hypothetical protein J1N35_007301 [Gossypium stocksii]|uniref:Reverse transcriptase zinc-binding domain-containing protein n=1 Tax=Gossypium stocksii TaxID=47602 RepID=A0A9D4AFF6_9ROSI|nr:hypothetical protein J1N35_007301 [Gossypium stocksii]
MGFGPHRFLWKAIWKLDTIHKIRECPRCGAEYETLIHALKDCPTSWAILSIGGLENSTILKEYNCCIDWLEDMMRVLDKRAMADLMTTLWNSWNNKNNFIFRGKEDEAQLV